MVQSSEKGAEFERFICRKLSLWVSDLRREDVFWRSAMSGGRATLHRRKGSEAKGIGAHAGDITATHPAGHLLRQLFVIDCKFYKSLGLEQLMFERNGFINFIWHEPRVQAAAENSEPLVIAKQNRQNELVMTSANGLKILNQGAERPLRVTCIFPMYDMHILPLRAVLTQVNVAKLRTVYGDTWTPDSK